MKHKKIKNLVVNVLEPTITFIKRSRARSRMPFKEIDSILKIFFPKTRHYKYSHGFFKHVFIINDGYKKLALKIGRSRRHIQKDYTTYRFLCNRLGERKANKYYAKIYWREGLFMLQKYGKKVQVPKGALDKLYDLGKNNGLKDVREANIMKVGNHFKIVDAERS